MSNEHRTNVNSALAVWYGSNLFFMRRRDTIGSPRRNGEYTQAGDLFRLINPEQRERLFGDIARHMQAGNTSQEIQVRQIWHFFRGDPAYGIGAVAPSS